MSQIIRYLFRKGLTLVQTIGSLAGIINGSSEVIGKLIWQGYLYSQNPSSDGSSIVTGTLSSTNNLEAVSNGNSTVTGTLNAPANLIGTINGQANVLGNMDFVTGFIFSQSNGSSTVIGLLGSKAFITSDLEGSVSTSTVTGSLINGTVYLNTLTAIVINDPDDDGKEPYPVNYATPQIGKWFFTPYPVLTVSQPSYFKTIYLLSNGINSPKKDDNVRTDVRNIISASYNLAHNPSIGHKLHYLISDDSLYDANDLQTILDNMIEISPVLIDGVYNYGSFPWDTFTAGATNFYLIHDYRKVSNNDLIEGQTGSQIVPNGQVKVGLFSGSARNIGQTSASYPESDINLFSIFLKRVGNPDFDLTGAIYINNIPFFGTLVETSPKVVSAADVPVEGAWYHFQFTDSFDYSGLVTYIDLKVENNVFSDANNYIEAPFVLGTKNLETKTRKYISTSGGTIADNNDYICYINGIAPIAICTGTLTNATP